MHGYGRGVECDDAARIAQLPHRQEGRGFEVGNNMNAPGRARKAGKVEFGLMRGVHDATVRIGYANRASSRPFVDDCCGYRAEMGGAAAIGNGTETGRNGNWGGDLLKL